jgi:hypothetical protein
MCSSDWAVGATGFVAVRGVMDHPTGILLASERCFFAASCAFVCPGAQRCFHSSIRHDTTAWQGEVQACPLREGGHQGA